ncbi:MAG: Ig-like domain-containing protein, partial [Thermoproteota archaeon]
MAVATSTQPDTTAPTVAITAPLTNTTISAVTSVTASVSDNVGVSNVQFLLDGTNLDVQDSASPYSIQWDTTTSTNGIHTLAARARDLAGNIATSSSITITVNNTTIPTQGPGGPILIVGSLGNPFSTYYKEILLAEGFNMYRLMDISVITAIDLATADVVILGDIPLTATQATMFTDWVNNGGNLIAMRPDASLSNLLGITSQGTSVSNAYFKINTTSAPGKGIADAILQFHGTADRYTLNGATEIASLYTNPATPLNAPSVTMHSVGTSGGHAAAFLFDLARSVIYTRQGNPAWSGQLRSGSMLCSGPCSRSVDLFFGNASFDPQPNWVDLANVHIPQADEAQRLLVNMILDMLV